MLEGHIAKAYDGALSSLHVHVVEAGGLVLSQIQNAIIAYAEWRPEPARLVLAREANVNGYEVAVEEEATRIIALRQPVASDLRSVLRIAKAVAELERIGDEAKKIARLVIADSERYGFRPGPATAMEVRQLGRLALNLVRTALEAFDHLDASRAAEVIRQERELDEEYANGLRRLLTRAMEDPRSLQAAVESAFVLKAIERIGDHGRNLARQVLALTGTASAQSQLSPALTEHGGADHTSEHQAPGG